MTDLDVQPLPESSLKGTAALVGSHFESVKIQKCHYNADSIIIFDLL